MQRTPGPAVPSTPTQGGLSPTLRPGTATNPPLTPVQPQRQSPVVEESETESNHAEQPRLSTGVGIADGDAKRGGRDERTIDKDSSDGQMDDHDDDDEIPKEDVYNNDDAHTDEDDIRQARAAPIYDDAASQNTNPNLTQPSQTDGAAASSISSPLSLLSSSPSVPGLASLVIHSDSVDDGQAEEEKEDEESKTKPKSVTGWLALPAQFLGKSRTRAADDVRIYLDYEKDGDVLVKRVERCLDRMYKERRQFLHGLNTCLVESYHSQRRHWAPKEQSFYRTWGGRAHMPALIRLLGTGWETEVMNRYLQHVGVTEPHLLRDRDIEQPINDPRAEPPPPQPPKWQVALVKQRDDVAAARKTLDSKRHKAGLSEFKRYNSRLERKPTSGVEHRSGLAMWLQTTKSTGSNAVNGDGLRLVDVRTITNTLAVDKRKRARGGRKVAKTFEEKKEARKKREKAQKQAKGTKKRKRRKQGSSSDDDSDDSPVEEGGAVRSRKREKSEEKDDDVEEEKRKRGRPKKPARASVTPRVTQDELQLQWETAVLTGLGGIKDRKQCPHCHYIMLKTTNTKAHERTERCESARAAAGYVKAE